MEDEHPTAAWEAMQDGNVFYRRQQVYSIPGKLPSLGDFVIAGCKYGGPLGELYKWSRRVHVNHKSNVSIDA